MWSIVIRDDEYALVEADLSSSIFRLTWKSEVPSAALRRILIQAHMQVMQHGLRSWLSDSRALTTMKEEDEDWILTTWTPMIFRTGLERMAIVPSKAVNYRRPLERIIASARETSPFQVQFFKTPQKGESWLLDRSIAVPN